MTSTVALPYTVDKGLFSFNFATPVQSQVYLQGRVGLPTSLVMNQAVSHLIIGDAGGNNYLIRDFTMDAAGVAITANDYLQLKLQATGTIQNGYRYTLRLKGETLWPELASLGFVRKQVLRPGLNLPVRISLQLNSGDLNATVINVNYVASKFKNGKGAKK